MTDDKKIIPSVSVSYACNGSSTKANALGMRPMQERAYERRGEQYLLIKSPPASGKSRALMFIALDKLASQGLKQAIIVVPEKTIGASFHDEPLSKYGFGADWTVQPKWNLCDAPGADNGGKVNSVGKFLDSEDKVLVCTHATFRFAVEKFGVEKFDGRLIAVDEFHHVSADPDSKLGQHLGAFIARDKVHILAMTGSYFRGDAVPVLAPHDEAKFDTVTYTDYEQLNGYEYLKQLDIGYFFYSGSYADDILAVLDRAEKTIIHIPSVNSRESTKDKIREVEHIIEALGEWQGIDPATGFQLVKMPDGSTLRIADLVDDDSSKRDRVSTALKDQTQKNNRDYVDIIIALGMAKEGFDWIWCEHVRRPPRPPSRAGGMPLAARAARPSIRPGTWFIVGGQKAYVAEMGEIFSNAQGRTDARLRVIFDNATESNLLMRSLQRALHRDEAGRRITDPTAGPLFAGEKGEDDLASGTIYVLRSKSDEPFVARNRDILHKIGVTGGDLKQRMANAKLDPTFLMADVEVAASYELFNINRTRLENLIHRIFDAARLDVEIRDRFGNPVIPREWFLVPRFVIDEAIERIKDGTITGYRYDPNAAALVRTG